MGLSPKQLADQRAALLAALDAEDARLLDALESEAAQPPVPPYRYDVRNRLPRSTRP